MSDIVTAALTASALKLTRDLFAAFRQSRVAESGTSAESRAQVEATLQNLSDSDRDALLRYLNHTRTPNVGVLGHAYTGTHAALSDEARARSEVAAGGLALALNSDDVFRDARKRIDLVFKLNLGIAIVLATILLIGIGGAVMSAVFFGRDIWAMAFGGVAVADLIGLYVFKPLTAINAAVIASQRLDGTHLRVREQLNSCNEYPDLERRIECQSSVWDTMQKELATLAGTA